MEHARMIDETKFILLPGSSAFYSDLSHSTFFGSSSSSQNSSPGISPPLKMNCNDRLFPKLKPEINSELSPHAQPFIWSYPMCNSVDKKPPHTK